MQSHICHVRTAYRRLPLGGKLSRKRLMRGDKSALMKGTLPTRPTHESSAIAALFTAPHHPIHQKLPCAATAAQRTRKIPSFQTGGCRAGKFGEMREVWREKDTLRKGVLLPPRSSPAPPRSFPYPFLRTYLRTKATARRASGIRIAKTMIQTTKTVTETFRRADGRTCDSPIGYCRSSPASHERIAAV